MEDFSSGPMFSQGYNMDTQEFIDLSRAADWTQIPVQTGLRSLGVMKKKLIELNGREYMMIDYTGRSSRLNLVQIYSIAEMKPGSNIQDIVGNVDKYAISFKNRGPIKATHNDGTVQWLMVKVSNSLNPFQWFSGSSEDEKQIELLKHFSH